MLTEQQITQLVDGLTSNETAITHIKKINGGKYSLQLVERMEADANPLALLNKSDERFGQSRVRPAWINGEAQDIVKQFNLKPEIMDQLNKLSIATGIPDAKLENGVTKLNLGIKNPSIQGMKLRVQIEEQVGVPQYDGQTAKRAGADGDFLTFNNELIYSTTKVVGTTPNHVKVVHNGRIPAAVSPVAQFAESTKESAYLSFIGDDEPGE
jgi:hypothetical protein